MEAILDAESAAAGAPRTRIAQLHAASASSKVVFVGGVVERVVLNNPAETAISITDESGTVICSLHPNVVHQFPMVTAPGTVLLLQNTTHLVNPFSPGMLVICAHNVCSVLVCDAPLPPSSSSSSGGSIRDSTVTAAAPILQNHPPTALPLPTSPSHSAATATATFHHSETAGLFPCELILGDDD